MNQKRRFVWILLFVVGFLFGKSFNLLLSTEKQINERSVRIKEVLQSNEYTSKNKTSVINSLCEELDINYLDEILDLGLEHSYQAVRFATVGKINSLEYGDGVADDRYIDHVIRSIAFEEDERVISEMFAYIEHSGLPKEKRAEIFEKTLNRLNLSFSVVNRAIGTIFSHQFPMYEANEVEKILKKTNSFQSLEAKDQDKIVNHLYGRPY